MASEVTCRICAGRFGAPVYHLDCPSLNSICKLYPGSGDIYFCEHCGHLQTTSLDNSGEYYQKEYKFHTGSLDEDRVYVDKEGRKKFETQFRAELLLDKLCPPPGTKILDYGCGKGSTVRRLVGLRPDLNLHLYDLTESYLDFWNQFCTPQNWAIGRIPHDWIGQFDVVTCFYAFERIEFPVQSVREIKSLLKPGGALYLMVPHVYDNPADFLAIDHTHHFSETSLRYMLESNGFSVEHLDTHSFQSAIIGVARAEPTPRGAALPAAIEVSGRKQRINELAAFWRQRSDRIREQETRLPACDNVAIYGAGFYGAYIFTRLAAATRVSCFVDQNPYLHGSEYFERKVVPPASLDTDIRNVFVGLNPRIARNAINNVREWKDRELNCLYLD